MIPSRMPKCKGSAGGLADKCKLVSTGKGPVILYVRARICQVCQGAGDALELRHEAGDDGPLSRNDIVRLLPQGYRRGAAMNNFKLAQSGPDVIVYFERCEGARITCGAGKACGTSRNGRLNDMVLPSGIPDGSLVCVARGEE